MKTNTVTQIRIARIISCIASSGYADLRKITIKNIQTLLNLLDPICRSMGYDESFSESIITKVLIELYSVGVNAKDAQKVLQNILTRFKK